MVNNLSSDLESSRLHLEACPVTTPIAGQWFYTLIPLTLLVEEILHCSFLMFAVS